jgi:D-alanyl-D-alanine carboxypeptidase
MPTEHRTTGDTLTPLGATLKQRISGGLQVVNLTGLTVKATVRTAAGTEAIAETTVGVVVVSATGGQVSYDFPSGSSALPAGTYYVYFAVYGSGGEATEFDTYPTAGPPANRLEVVFSDR